MGGTREPWFKVKVGIVRSEKIIGLSDDSARWGYVRLLAEAKVQRRMGVFASRNHAAEILGRHAAYLDEYIGRGLVEVAPALCADCAARHAPDQLKAGDVVVHDYLLEQRDPSNADRQGTWRQLQAALRALEAAGISVPVTDHVTADITLRPVTAERPPTPTPPTDVTPPSVTTEPPEPDPRSRNADRNGVLTGARNDGDGDIGRRPEKEHVLERTVVVGAERGARAVEPAPSISVPPEPSRRDASPGVSAARRVTSPVLATARPVPGWRHPCLDYVHHQSKHRIVDGQAVCDVCEAILAAAAAGPDPVAADGLGL